MSCRTCANYVVQPDKDGRIRMRKYSVSRCAAPIATETIAKLLPSSITQAAGFALPTDAHKRWMGPDDGSDCPLHEKRPRP